MTSIRYIRLLSLIVILLPFTLINAQHLDLPLMSQPASVMQRIGLLDVNIYYSRPNVRERIIWGELVPYNKVWRTGADNATNISFSEDVTLNGNNVPAGRYAFFTIPGREEWTIIINKTAKQWGAFNYDSTKDLIRFQVKPAETEFTESMEFTFSDVTTRSAVVNLKWEKLKVSFEIGFDVDKKAYENMRKILSSAGPNDWSDFAASANYLADNNIHLDKAMEWVDKSISYKPGFYNFFVKAKLLAKENKIKDALSYLDKSRTAGKNDPEYKGFSSTLEKFASELKEKNKR